MYNSQQLQELEKNTKDNDTACGIIFYSVYPQFLYTPLYVNASVSINSRNSISAYRILQTKSDWTAHTYVSEVLLKITFKRAFMRIQIFNYSIRTLTTQIEQSLSKLNYLTNAHDNGCQSGKLWLFH